ncbi:MAG TPA: glycosyltransferase [Mucilaginibacter sp.]
MKIFLAFLQSDKRYPIPAYDFWQRYIKNGIEEAGHQWVECPDADWALGLVPKSESEQLKWKEETWDNTVAWLKANPVDIFLGYLYPYQVDKSAIKEIQKMSIPCVNFFCDNVREFRKIPAAYEVFDLNWVPEHKALEMYNSAGFKFIHLPMPVWVAPEDRVIKDEVYNQVTLLGSKDIQRKLLIEEVIKLYPDIPLAVYGSGWKKGASAADPSMQNQAFTKRVQNQLSFVKNYGINAYYNKLKSLNYPYETDASILGKYKGDHQIEQYKVLTAASMITVGINRYPSYHFPIDRPDTYSRLRDIEAPMLGACYLTEWTEGIENLYEPQQEIALYHNAEDFVEKVKELKSDHKKRNMLKVNGQKRALSEHTIPNSLNKLIRTLGI